MQLTFINFHKLVIKKVRHQTVVTKIQIQKIKFFFRTAVQIITKKTSNNMYSVGIRQIPARVA